MRRAIIGLGSNEGDRLAHLRAATDAIARWAGVVRASAVYETAPIGGPAQGPFLNAAVLVDWGVARDPHALLEALLCIERALGRVRRERWGPRTIDLDLLWIEGTIVDSKALVVPHPRLGERAFALLPLLELAPDAIDPRTGAPLASAPAAAERGGWVRTGLTLR